MRWKPLVDCYRCHETLRGIPRQWKTRSLVRRGEMKLILTLAVLFTLFVSHVRETHPLDTDPYPWDY